MELAQIPIDSIVLDETQRRPGPDLVRSLDLYGQLLPIHVRRRDDGTDTIVDGSRRVGGGRELGWSTIAALVEAEGESGLPKDLAALIVNTARSNLSQLYVARHVRRLVNAGDCKQSELARELGRSEALLSLMLKVIECPDLEKAIERDGVEFSAARVLTALPQEERVELLADMRAARATRGRYPSVRWVEAQVRRRQGKEPSAPVPREAIAGLVEQLRERGLPIEIRTTRGKQTRVKVVLTVGEAERPLVEALTGGPGT